MTTTDHILASLKQLRITYIRDEASLQLKVADQLAAAGIAFEREVRLDGRSRVDFLAAGNVAIELKTGKPNSRRTIAQVTRYAAFTRVSTIILVVERNIFWLPDDIDGKPVHYVALSSNWGIAL